MTNEGGKSEATVDGDESEPREAEAGGDSSVAVDGDNAGIRDASGVYHPVPSSQILRIQLEGFEGPLDLLLHLIRKHEIEITDIPIAFITEEYLAYLEAMNQLDLSIAGEYLVMAATLLYIKSKELLPDEEGDDDEFDEDFDPRADLVRRLLEYQKYRDAAERLEGLDKLGTEVFARPSRADRYRDDAGPAELMPIDLFRLLDVYRDLLAHQEEPAVHEVTREELSMKQTIGSIASYLNTQPRTSLLDLLYALDERPSVHRIVVTFMSLLEMAKLKLVRLFQARLTTDDLIIERAVVDIEEFSQRLDLMESDADGDWDDEEYGDAETDGDTDTVDITNEEDVRPDAKSKSQNIDGDEEEG